MNSLNDFLMAEVSGLIGFHLSIPALMKIIFKILFKYLSNPEEFSTLGKQ